MHYLNILQFELLFLSRLRELKTPPCYFSFLTKLKLVDGKAKFKRKLDLIFFHFCFVLCDRRKNIFFDVTVWVSEMLKTRYFFFVGMFFYSFIFSSPLPMPPNRACVWTPVVVVCRLEFHVIDFRKKIQIYKLTIDSRRADKRGWYCSDM